MLWARCHCFQEIEMLLQVDAMQYPKAREIKSGLYDFLTDSRIII